jgi:hypothetical protein
MATRNALSATRLLMIAVKEKPVMQTKSRRNKWKPKNRKLDSGDNYNTYTRAFFGRQKFGAASAVRSISIEDYLKEKQKQ